MGAGRDGQVAAQHLVVVQHFHVAVGQALGQVGRVVGLVAVHAVAGEFDVADDGGIDLAVQQVGRGPQRVGDHHVDALALFLLEGLQALQQAAAYACRALHLAGVVVALRADDVAIGPERQQVVALAGVVLGMAGHGHEPAVGRAAGAKVAAQQAVLAGVDGADEDDDRLVLHVRGSLHGVGGWDVSEGVLSPARALRARRR